jgi:hypothetical protein
MPFRPSSLLALALAASPLLAQQPASAPSAPSTIWQKEPEDAFAREFKPRLFIVQHRSPKALYEAVLALCSGARGYRLEYIDRDGVKAISVRDFPENVATIEAALKRLDVPQAAQATPEVELHIHVLFANKTEGPSEGFPGELKEVLKTLKSTLAYRSFTPVTSFVSRVRDDSNHMAGVASPEVIGLAGDPGDKGPARLKVEYQAQYLKISNADPEPAKISIQGFFARIGILGTPVQAELRTDLTLKDGEKVVVGTSTLKDRGLIVVITAKVLK